MSGTGERNTTIAEGGTQSIPVADDVSCAGQTRTHDVIIDRLLARRSSRYECRPVYRDDINAISGECLGGATSAASSGSEQLRVRSNFGAFVRAPVWGKHRGLSSS